jgi:hypothetical protein
VAKTEPLQHAEVHPTKKANLAKGCRININASIHATVGPGASAKRHATMVTVYCS